MGIGVGLDERDRVREWGFGSGWRYGEGRSGGFGRLGLGYEERSNDGFGGEEGKARREDEEERRRRER